MSKEFIGTFPDLSVERDGLVITRVTKAGVVIWPQEPHNTPMAQDTSPYIPEDQRVDRLVRANDTMVGGDHYRGGDAVGTCPHCRKQVQHWDWSHNLRGLEYAITKYIARWRSKEKPLESLQKVIHYTQKLIEIHFPNVVVNISFSNSVLQESGCDSQELVKGQQYFEELRKHRGPEAAGGAGVVGGQTAHSPAVDKEYLRRCQESADRIKGDLF